MSFVLTVFLTGAWGLQAQSCLASTASADATLQKFMSAPPPDMSVQAGDLLSISAFSIKAYSVTARVEADGTATLPLIGNVALGHLTVGQAQELVQKLLKEQEMIVAPQVSIVITESPSRVVSVSGEVNKAGTFPDIGRHSLYEFIADANGMTRTACHIVTLKRVGMESIQIDTGNDPGKSQYASMAIYPGDSIQVPALGVIYVVGALKLQGAFGLKAESPTTVLDAITLAGGIGFEAMTGSSIVVRKSGEGTLVISIDPRKMLQGKQQDFALRADDIVFVPTNKMKAAIKGGAAGLASSLVSALIYSNQL